MSTLHVILTYPNITYRPLSFLCLPSIGGVSNYQNKNMKTIFSENVNAVNISGIKTDMLTGVSINGN